MNREKQIRAILNDLINLVTSGKLKTKANMQSTYKELLAELRMYNLQYVPSLIFDYKVLTKKQITWKNKLGPFLKNAVILFWVYKGYEKTEDFKYNHRAIVLALRTKKVTIYDVLKEYDFKTRLTKWGKEDPAGIKRKIIDDYIKNYLTGKYPDFDTFRNKNSRALQHLSKNYNITATQVLAEAKIFHSKGFWENKTGPELEKYVLILWNFEKYENIKELSVAYEGLYKYLREKHYTTFKDAIKKAKVIQEKPWLPYLLDYLVCKFLKKRIKDSTLEEVKGLTIHLSQRKIQSMPKIEHYKPIKRLAVTGRTTEVIQLFREYSCRIFKKIHSTKIEDLKPEKPAEIFETTPEMPAVAGTSKF